jgi:hypothetical protein
VQKNIRWAGNTFEIGMQKLVAPPGCDGEVLLVREDTRSANDFGRCEEANARRGRRKRLCSWG